MPFINHISKFGIEHGLASLQFNYGYYSLQFFGQSVFQKLYSNENFLFPSINIVFFGLYISYFASKVFILPFDFVENKDISNNFKNTNFFRIFTILYFFSSILFCSEGLLISLSSYTQNLGIFYCGSIICFIFLSSSFVNSTKYEIIGLVLLTFYAPLLKGSGVIAGFFTLLVASLYLLFFKNRKLILFSLNPKNLNIDRNYFLIIFLIIFSYLITFLTNTITTGFPLFPSPFLGPIGDNYMADIDVKNIKELIINFARFGKENPDKIFSDLRFFEWFPIYIKTRNGIYYIFSSIIPTFISICISLFHQKDKNQNFKITKLFLFSFALFLTELICMIFLVPELRYYTWFTPVSMFLLFYCAIYLIGFKSKKLIKLVISLYCIFCTLFLFFIWPLSISNSTVLRNIPKSFFSKPTLTKVETKLYEVPITKWQPINSSTKKRTLIRVPINSDQCWGSTTPCSPYILEGIPLGIKELR